MPGAKKSFIGLEGFIWYIGVVEDRQDPEQLGRVRVRCFGWHTDEKSKIPTEQLPWAHPVIPVNSPNAYTPKEGDMVFGFFMDGDNAQNPAIMGVFPGKPDGKPNYTNGFSDPRTSFGSAPNKPDDPAEAYPKGKYLKEQTTNRLARGKADSTVIATRKKNLKKNIVSAGGVSWSEPPPAFAPKYPYNNALETESGHALEFDDTPGQERIQLAHRKGSFIEIDRDGNEVHKVVKDNYELVMGSDYVFISGKCSVTVGGDCNLKVGGNMNVEVAGGINMSAGGDIRMKGKSVFVESTATMDLKSGSTTSIQSSGKSSIKGSQVALSGSSVEVDGTLNVKSGTNLKATGADSRGDSHNLSVSGSGASSASSAAGAGLSAGGMDPEISDLQAASESNKIIESSVSAVSSVAAAAAAATTAIASASDSIVSVGSTIGKSAAGITETINNIFTDITKNADVIIKDFSSKLPIGELTQKVQIFEGAVNMKRGEILSLKENLKNDIVDKIGNIQELSTLRNIEFNVDSDLLPPQITEKINTVLGKRVYPLTESISAVDQQITNEIDRTLNRLI
jgi:hypothetical protein